ncbi:MAG: hypothetical protein CMH49_00675 [Myxococcales bacterium]|nr:hypothetical protein [Myxococcales bacterium]
MSSKASYEEMNHRLALLCENLLQSLVQDPDEVSVKSARRKFTIRVSEQDRGLVIGRGGQNLRALEDVLLLANEYMPDSDPSYNVPSFEVRVSDSE